MNLSGNPFFLTREQEAWVTSTLASLTTEEKVHQMFCVLGDATGPEKLTELAKEGIGGILFRPVRPAAEIAGDFKKYDALSPIPLLHAANLEEGGAGGASDKTFFANQLQIAASTRDEDEIHFAEVCASEGCEADINWTFSPVSDINVNYMNPITNARTYGSDKDRVKKLATMYVETLQKSGMAACAKHFPGDGVDYRDQHLHPTYNTLSAQEWRESYGAIYRSMIEKGLLSVMCGHICQPAMEAEYSHIDPSEALPGSLSRGLLTGVLRGELGFNGVITTDATIMGGYTMPMPREKAIPTTFAAGCDLIVFTTDIDEDFAYTLKGIEDGILSMERVDEAVTRVLALKAKVCGNVHAAPVPAKEWQKQCAENSVTLVKDKDHVIPVSAAKYPKVRLMIVGEDECWDGSLKEMFTAELQKRGCEVELYDPFADDLHGTSKLPKDRLTLAILNYPHASNQTTVRVKWCPKHALEIPRFVNEETIIFASMWNPFHLQDVPRARAFINAYTANKATVEAVVEKLFGESEFIGVNPVDPFCGLSDTRL